MGVLYTSVTFGNQLQLSLALHGCLLLPFTFLGEGVDELGGVPSRGRIGVLLLAATADVDDDGLSVLFTEAAAAGAPLYKNQ